MGARHDFRNSDPRQPVALLEWIAEKNLRNGLLDPDMRDTLKDELEAKIAGLK